jgi:hypothetical protein
MDFDQTDLTCVFTEIKLRDLIMKEDRGFF